MNVSEVGEKKVIELISKKISYPYFQKNSVSSSDAEIVDLGMDNYYLAITMDSIDEGIDIFPEMTPYQIGWALVNVNFSDLAAVGAKPLCLLSSWGIPKNFEVLSIEKIAEGLNDAARFHDAYVIGGDLNNSSQLYFSGCAFGLVKKNSLMTRSGAKVGDLIFVTGFIGGANAGYLSLVKEVHLPKSIISNVKDKLFQPTARVKESIILSENGYISSCIDISDGLVASSLEIAKNSNVGIFLNNNLIPYHPDAVKVIESLKIDTYMLSVWGAGDYELLFTSNRENLNDIIRLFSNQNLFVSLIGEITPYSGQCILEVNQKQINFESGFEHFKDINAII